MTKLHSTLVTILLVTSIACVAAIADMALSGQRLLDTLRANAAGNLNTGLYNASALLYQTKQDEQVTADKLNRDGGLIQVTQKAVAAYRTVAGEAAIAEKKSWGAVESNSNQVAGRINATLTKLDTSADKLNVVLDHVPGLIDSGKGTLDAVTKVVTDIDANLINDPDVKNSLQRISSILGSADLTAQDVQKIVHSIEVKVTAPPTKKQKILAILEMVYRAALIDVALKAK